MLTCCLPYKFYYIPFVSHAFKILVVRVDTKPSFERKIQCEHVSVFIESLT